MTRFLPLVLCILLARGEALSVPKAETHSVAKIRSSTSTGLLSITIPADKKPSEQTGLWSRQQVLQRGGAWLGAGAAALVGVGALPLEARADSTGKYSTKATARKRYLPRIRAALDLFLALPEAIEAGRWSQVEEFLGEPRSDLKTAMTLFASSQKAGELPDAKSQKNAKRADDVYASLGDLAKAAKTKNTNKALAAYENTKSVLEEYITELKLPPLGSDEWSEFQKQ
eukprot:CAMPEP_0113944306 /NCGR_PEP_ID=MMETSP1339-20121228/33092_1 /TAXON_ID=94617 /ORGANISM="Fibrocapsa japonica" /LENGTH=227 /DNA_ID=CAMNT_0000949471 /DNA_START=121 /DNA_END=804 /DNA_ORIENTATION=+ /assembly_acc=CAM_ASM_000762